MAGSGLPAMGAQDMLSLTQQAGPLLAALALSSARMLGLLSILPLSTRLGLTGLLRGGVALALALPVAPALLPALHADPVSGPRLLLLGVKEAFVGLLLGILFAVPFWAAEAAGELIDQQRGSRGAVLPDAAQEAQTGITGTLLVLALTTIFLLHGGMGMLVDAIYDSYQIWPPLDPAPRLAGMTGTEGAGAPGAAALLMLGALDRILESGFLLASPLLVAMILVELALALVSRFAPQLNVFDLAMSAKGLVTVLGMPVYAVFLMGYLRDGLAPLASFAVQLHQISGR